MSDIDRDVSRPPVRPRQKRRIYYPNLSPTRVIDTQSGADSWGAWTDTPIEQLDWDAFDEDGHPLQGRR